MFGKVSRSVKPNQNSNVSVTDVGPCQKALRLRVGLEAIAPVRAAVVDEFCKRVTLPGFRKGKAPADLVERKYAQPIQEELLHRVTNQTFEQVIKDHDLRPIGPVALGRADFSQTDGLTLEATVEVEPAFTLGDYKGIPLKRKAATITAEEIDQALKVLQDSMAQLVPKGEGQPKERHLPAIDDELAKDVGFEHLEQLKQHVEAKLREQKRVAQARALEAALGEELLKRHAFEVPPRLVSHQTGRVTRDFKARLLLSGMDAAQAEDEVKKFAERLRQSAEQHVRLGFILDRIATQESVSVKEEEVVGRLWQVAQHWKKDPLEVRKMFDAQGLWPSVISTIRQEKTMALLMAASAIDEGGPA